jgi:hypothetical protein
MDKLEGIEIFFMFLRILCVNKNSVKIDCQQSIFKLINYLINSVLVPPDRDTEHH